MALSDILGQAKPIELLKKSAAAGRVASAYLFHVLSGIGKRQTALNFAKALNCAQPVSTAGQTDACDACPSCRKINAGVHPDVITIEPAKDVIKIDEIRQLIETLSLSAFEGRFKIAIVDEAHLMNDRAANAFLKCLEEPPAQSVIILVSSSPERLPDTVRSRCLAVAFKPLSAAQVEGILKTRLASDAVPGASARGRKKTTAHDININTARLARLSMGRPGLALKGELPGAGGEDFINILSRMASGVTQPSWEDKAAMASFLDQMELFLRDLLVMKATGQPGLLLDPEFEKQLSQLARYVPEEVIIETYSNMNKVRGALVYNPNKAIIWNYMACLALKLNINKIAPKGF